MSLCPSCFNRSGRRTCPDLGFSICLQCCAERRREKGKCSSACSHFEVVTRESLRGVRSVAARHGNWLSPRLRAFAMKEEVFTAVLDLEETICRFSMEDPEVTDNDILRALDYLRMVEEGGACAGEPPNDLGRWLADCLKSAWDLDFEEDSFPPLLMLGLFPLVQRRSLLREVRKIIGAEVATAGYLNNATGYFRDMRVVEGRSVGSRSRKRQDSSFSSPGEF